MTEATAKTTAKKAKTVAIDDAETFGTRVSEGAREFVKRSAATAKERSDGLYDASKRYNSELENMLVRAARGYTDILGNLAEATYVNVNRAVETAEKLSAAKNLSEAMQIQTDYVRDQANCSAENARSAYNYMRETMTAGVEEVRENASKLWNSEKAA